MVITKIPEKDMMYLGLMFAGHDQENRKAVSPALQLERFRDGYGASPAAYCAIFESLQTTTVEAAHVAHPKVEDLLYTGRWLTKYQTQNTMAGDMSMCEQSAASACWCYAKKLQALKVDKLLFDETMQREEIIVLTVDGVHFQTRECRKEPSTFWYSFKHHGPGLTYELGISIWTDRLVWINGPFKSSKNDISMFRSDLKDKIPAGKRGLGDKAYGSEPSKMMVKDPLDSENLAKFKTRALARHETFNRRIKRFGILKQEWRHGLPKHRIILEAVCVVVQFDMENGNPLLEI